MEITEAGGVWSIKTSTTLKSMDLKFKVHLYLYLYCIHLYLYFYPLYKNFTEKLKYRFSSCRIIKLILITITMMMMNINMISWEKNLMRRHQTADRQELLLMWTVSQLISMVIIIIIIIMVIIIMGWVDLIGIMVRQ